MGLKIINQGVKRSDLKVTHNYTELRSSMAGQRGAEGEANCGVTKLPSITPT